MDPNRDTHSTNGTHGAAAGPTGDAGQPSGSGGDGGTRPGAPASHPPPERPISGARGRPGFLAVALLVALGAAAGAGGLHLLQSRGDHDHGSAAAKTRYTCPMHPTYVSERQGDCPICGMKLVPLQASGEVKPEDAAAHAAAHEHGGGTVPTNGAKYYCPMHPEVTSDDPNARCDKCGGMKLVPVPATATATGGASGERKIAFYRSPHDAKQTSPTPKKDSMGMDYVPVYQDELNGTGAPVSGLATVQIDPQRQQLIGLRTAKASRGTVAGSWRTVGRVAVDETRVHHINVKVDGFVEHIHVDFTGMAVRKGDPLFSLYSPELVSAQSEYLLAVKTRASLASTSAARDGDDLVESARQRLRYWDIPESAVEALERTGKPQKTLTFYSPISGVVTKKDVVHGHKLSAGDMPYEVTDLSNVWVLADVYESEIARVKVGMPAKLSLKAFPNRTFKGKVIFVDPLLDPGTRTAKVRLSFANPTGELRPELFGEVELFTPSREGVSIPFDAVVDSGTKTVVFVSLGDGKFQPREVRIGQQSGDRVEVTSGLRDGEEVVTRANFLVDSESRLKASLSAMGAK